jgi:hypothetical protein
MHDYHNPVNPSHHALSSTPTPILVRRALTCRRLQEINSPRPNHELVTVERVGGLAVVLSEIRRRETIGGAR